MRATLRHFQEDILHLYQEFRWNPRSQCLEWVKAFRAPRLVTSRLVCVVSRLLRPE
jgi:hypothetical protein